MSQIDSTGAMKDHILAEMKRLNDNFTKFSGQQEPSDYGYHPRLTVTPEEQPTTETEPGEQPWNREFRSIIQARPDRPIITLTVERRTHSVLIYKDEATGLVERENRLSPEEQEIIDRYVECSGLENNINDQIDDGLSTSREGGKLRINRNLLEAIEESKAETDRQIEDNFLRFQTLITQAAALASWMASEYKLDQVLTSSESSRKITKMYQSSSEMLEPILEMHTTTTGIEEFEELDEFESEDDD